MNAAQIDRSDWHLVHCARLATSPLRFMGRLLDERPSGLKGFSFSVYERQKGGLATVLPGWSRGQWRADAFRASDWSDLFDEVERRCGGLSVPSTEKLSPKDILDTHLRFIGERDRVLEAAGHALDHWQRMAEAQAD